MAAIAPTRADYDNHRVSPLPRLGAILIALVITVAGVAPLFTGGEEATIIETSAGQELAAPAPAADTSAAQALGDAAPPADAGSATPVEPAAPAATPTP